VEDIEEGDTHAHTGRDDVKEGKNSIRPTNFK